MANIPQKVVHKYLRHNKKFPHVWCPGCSNGTTLGSIIRAIAELNYDRDGITMVSGIGCSSRMPVYVDFNTLHTLHGRALPFATGIKMTKPEQKVIVITGDGDATAIGGNHFIHACRRNIDMTAIVLNNNIYGMTGGQYSPTTPTGDRATTSPYGNIDPVFDICELAMAAGATFVARTTAFNAIETQSIIKDALEHKGFSVVEVVSSCPVIYGRLNKKGDGPEMMKYMRDNSVPLKATEKMTPEQLEGKIVRGIFKRVEKQEYCEAYAGLVAKFQNKEEAKK
ncbi:MAG: 2-oxoacid:ferredoxin oxidoreductase subunit beta [Candidatus Cloacimonetes bacterium]|nr:2-oxoacid:ferredoxin oxidoreductase subunit beta [Candidatus Cloacimonadota bacterium]